VRDAEERVRRAEARVTELEGQIERGSARIALLERELAAAARTGDRVTDLEAQVERGSARIATLEQELAAAARAGGRVTQLEAQLEEAVRQGDRAQARVTELEAEVARARADLEEAREAAERRGLFGRRAARAPVEDPARVAELEAKVGALRAQLEKATASEPVLVREPAPEPTEPRPAVTSRPTLPDLERLVAEAARRRRPEAEEWGVYVALLRQHAEPGGAIPAEFDDLLRDVFGAWD
jgi:DNA repair exonuclease SbcCD ATPase subunit